MTRLQFCLGWSGIGALVFHEVAAIVPKRPSAVVTQRTPPSKALAEAFERIEDIAQGPDRVLIAIVGPPGAGKSTIAQALATGRTDAALLPMDGFHLDNDILHARGLFHRKGAPETFDTMGLHALLHRVKAGGGVRVPTFNRAADCVVPDGALIRAEDKVVVVEGNYLLLDRPGWRALHGFWDFTISLNVARDVLEQRLVDRWQSHGLSPQAARERAKANDLPNADVVRSESIAADITLTNM